MLSQQKNKNTVRATDLRDQAADIINRVEYGRETIIVEKHKKPRVVMIPYEEFMTRYDLVLSDADRKRFLASLDKAPPPNPALKKAMKAFQKKSR